MSDSKYSMANRMPVVAVNDAADADARIAAAAGADPNTVMAIAMQPIPSLRTQLLQNVAALAFPRAQPVGSDPASLIPTRSSSGTGGACAATPGGDNLPGLLWTDIAAIEAYDGPWEFYEKRAPFALITLHSAPNSADYQGRVRAQATASPLDLAAAQPAGTQSRALGLRLEVTVPGDSAPAAGSFVFSYVDASGVARTLNLTATPIAGRKGTIRIVPGLASLYGRPARHNFVVNNAKVVTSLGLLAPVTATTVAFSGFPSNTVVAAELIQPGSPMYLDDIEAIARGHA